MTVVQVIDIFRLFEEKTPRELASILLSRLSSYVNEAGVKYSLNSAYWLHNAVDIYTYLVHHPRRYIKLVITTRDGLELVVHVYEDSTLYYEIHSIHTCDCNCGE